MLSRRAGLSAIAGLSCYLLIPATGTKHRQTRNQMLSRSAQYELDSKISRSYPQRFDANSWTENVTNTLTILLCRSKHVGYFVSNF